uniref:Uncharacterized protein n=1 Tax=Arundo donax TaxID=35708 RepID=A0A0A9F5V9_ARUDO
MTFAQKLKHCICSILGALFTKAGL